MRIKKRAGETTRCPLFVKLLSGFWITLFVLVERQTSRQALTAVEATLNDEYTESKSKKIDLPPGTTSIVLNIGPNLEPIMPRATEGPCALTLAFEPIVADEIPKHPQLHVVPAAVSDAYDITTMYKYNKQSMSSSLSKAASSDWWNTGRQNGGTKIVPVIPMLEILRSIPDDVRIDFVNTDMQGFDFTAVSSATGEIRRRGVKHLKTEVNFGHVVSYEGTRNDICDHWLPLMSSHGYKLVMLQSMTNKEAVQGYSSHDEAMETCRSLGNRKVRTDWGYNEADALWTLAGEELPPISTFDYQTVQDVNKTPVFTKEDYATCRTAAKSSVES